MWRQGVTIAVGRTIEAGCNGAGGHIIEAGCNGDGGARYRARVEC